MRKRQMNGLLYGLAVATVAWIGFATASDASARDEGLDYDASYRLVSMQNDSEKGTLKQRVAALEEAIAKADAAAKKAKAAAAKKPSVKVDGRVFLDWTWFTQDAGSVTQIGDQENGFEPRAAWIGVGGKMNQVFEWKLSMNFAGTQPNDLDDDFLSPVFQDTYGQMNELPLVGHAKIGYFKEPMSLELQTSSRFITFMERSFVNDMIPSYNLGGMIFDTAFNDRVTWATGVFTGNLDNRTLRFQDDGHGAFWTSRATFLPWYDEGSGGRGLWHVGGSYSYHALNGEDARYRARPQCHIGSRIVDTTAMAANYTNTVGVETAFLYGPFSIQSEYVEAYVNRTGGDETAQFNAFYIQTSFFLTGENRSYSKKKGSFGRVTPYEPVFRVRDADGCIQTGKGAWEVAYRLSTIDLNDADITGGNATTHTLGLNWYLTPNMRVVLNYINAETRKDGTTGIENIFMTRYQYDW